MRLAFEELDSYENKTMIFDSKKRKLHFFIASPYFIFFGCIESVAWSHIKYVIKDL